jgi:hypothetical protein
MNFEAVFTVSLPYTWNAASPRPDRARPIGEGMPVPAGIMCVVSAYTIDRGLRASFAGTEQSEGPEPRPVGKGLMGAPALYEKPVCRARGRICCTDTVTLSAVPAPPGVVMVAPPEVPRNASRAQSKGRVGEDESVQRGQGQYKGRSPKARPRS